MEPEKEENSLKFQLGQLAFWSIVFGLVLIFLIGWDELIKPLLQGTFCP